MIERVDLKLGWSCNNRCRFCVQGNKRHQYGDRSTAEALALLERARQGADAVVLTGGEVTLRPDLVQVVQRARELGYRHIQLQTNGRRLADERLCDALFEAGVTEFSPALHAPLPEAHDYLTRAPGSFRQTVRGIVNVKRRSGRVVTNSVLTRSTYRLVGALAQLLVRLGVDQYQLAFPHPLGSAAAAFSSIVPRLSAVAPYLPEGLTPGIRAGRRVMTEAIPLCFLKGFESSAAEWGIPRTQIFDAEQVIDDYTAYRAREGKALGPPCQHCAWLGTCEGPWREYPERFGWGEFQPAATRSTPSQGAETP